jgi:hypothetical protein
VEERREIESAKNAFFGTLETLERANTGLIALATPTSTTGKRKGV